MKRAGFDLVRDLLDHELVDVEGVPCGMVDDVEIAGGGGKPLRVVALLSGPGAVAPRLPAVLARLVRRLWGDRVVRIPLDAIKTIDERVTLARTAEALHLRAVDRKWGRWIARLPGA
jgi:sporulation protein YlmC with PRC-barrel domain